MTTNPLALSAHQLAKEYESLSDLWTIKDSGRLSLEYTSRDFVTAMKNLNDVAVIAEDKNHHPDLHLTSYRCVSFFVVDVFARNSRASVRNVEIILYTHTVNGLTLLDFDLARAIDSNVDFVFSKKWLRDRETQTTK